MNNDRMESVRCTSGREGDGDDVSRRLLAATRIQRHLVSLRSRSASDAGRELPRGMVDDMAVHSSPSPSEIEGRFAAKRRKGKRDRRKGGIGWEEMEGNALKIIVLLWPLALPPLPKPCAFFCTLHGAIPNLATGRGS